MDSPTEMQISNNKRNLFETTACYVMTFTLLTQDLLEQITVVIVGVKPVVNGGL